MEISILNVVLTTLFFIGCSWGQNISLRVFNGDDAEDDEVPYIVSIMFNLMHICGGTIINEEWIITAAHCVHQRTDLEVFAGSVDLTIPGEYLQISTVKEAFVHPLYDKRKYSIIHNVALLHLNTKLVFNEYVAAIKIIGENELKEGITNQELGIISGWGANEHSFLSNSLFSGMVTLLNEEECSKVAVSPECGIYNPEIHLCTKFEKPASGAGFMDDGGPLVLRNKLAGIILHGENLRYKMCPYLSSIYANVRYYKDFIEAHIPNILESKEDPSEDETLFELEFVLEAQNTSDSDIDKFVSESYTVKSFNYWFRTGEDKNQENQFNYLIQEDNDIETIIINVKLVKSQNHPKAGVSFELSKYFNITPYLTIRHIK